LSVWQIVPGSYPWKTSCASCACILPLIALFIDSFKYRVDEVLLILFLSPW
jgi:hypothetical protein